MAQEGEGKEERAFFRVPYQCEKKEAFSGIYSPLKKEIRWRERGRRKCRAFLRETRISPKSGNSKCSKKGENLILGEEEWA